MNFALGDEHRMQTDLVRRFVDDELLPLEHAVLKREADTGRLELAAAERERLDDVARRIGLWGLDAPASMGGHDLPVTAMVGVHEELARSVTPYELPPDSPNLRMLLETASEAQRRDYLEPYARGRTVSAIAIS